MDISVLERDRTPVDNLIVEFAAANPEHVALRYANRSISYQDLVGRATQLAALLAQAGVRRGDVVGVCIARSFGPIVACLATLRVGAAFLLLDSADPPERRNDLFADAAVTLAIVEKRHEADYPACRCLFVDEEGRAETFNQNASAASLVETELYSPDQLAYLVYTSGSTGRPNAAEISHANLNNLIAWHCARFALTDRDIGSHIASLGFDAAIWEVWPYLAVGATVSIADDVTRTSPDLLAAWLISEGITVGFVPTALAEHLIAMTWPDEVPLRYLLTGGDRLRAHPRHSLPFRLINNYGPCECTVVATSGEVPTIVGNKEQLIHAPGIGTPIDGVRVDIVDEAGEMLPDGIEGEIWIGGLSVGRGYRNRPALTARSFVPDRFDSRPGALMYRTGDRGVRLGNGEIHFRGRTDRQVKVRGVRIELDEIATTLQGHPDVASAVVLARDLATGPQIDAYIVPAPHLSPAQLNGLGATELYSYISTKMPAAYRPSSFIMINALPLTQNGKVDFLALPLPTLEPRASEFGDRGLNEIEKRVAAIIESSLQLGEIDPEDNFFLLGGHSLLATQVIIRTREEFEIEASLSDLFEAPTIRTFSRTIDSRLESKVAAMTLDEVRARLELRPV